MKLSGLSQASAMSIMFLYTREAYSYAKPVIILGYSHFHIKRSHQKNQNVVPNIHIIFGYIKVSSKNYRNFPEQRSCLNRLEPLFYLMCAYKTCIKISKNSDIFTKVVHLSPILVFSDIFEHFVLIVILLSDQFE